MAAYLMNFNRKAIAAETAFSFPSLGVINAMERAMKEYGKQEKVRMENGPEFTSSTFMDWCKNKGVSGPKTRTG